MSSSPVSAIQSASPTGARSVWRDVWPWLLAAVACVTILRIEPVQASLREWPGRWLHILLVSGLFSACLTPVVGRLAFRFGAVDLPDRRKVHDRPTPRLGGIAVFSAIVLALWFNGVPDTRIYMLLVAAAGLHIIGVADDLKGVRASQRLGVQILASLVVISSGTTLQIFPQEPWLGSTGNILLTLLWLVGITNAFNFFDGMDGLAGGLSVVMAGFLGVIAFNTGQPQLGWVSMAIIGSCLGFLPHNFRWRGPARIFLGDGGSTALGFLLAALAVHGEWAVGHPMINLAAPLLIFGVLIFDMLHTTVARTLRGDVRSVRQWLEYTGRDHLHHRFEVLLRSKRKAVLLIHLLAVTLGLTALLIRQISPGSAILLLLQSAAILVVVTILEHAGNVRERRNIR